MPAVTMRFDMTKEDMRNGRKTGCPVSVMVRLDSPTMAPHCDKCTRVQRRIHDLLCLPYLRCHRFDLPLFVGGDELLCIFKS